jgi:hypothetical protein
MSMCRKANLLYRTILVDNKFAMARRMGGSSDRNRGLVVFRKDKGAFIQII